MKRWICFLLCGCLLATMSGCAPEEQALTFIPTDPTDEAPLGLTMPDLSDVADSAATVIYTQNTDGEWSEMLTLPGGAVRAKLDTVLDVTKQAFLAAVDPTFYEHNGKSGDTVTVTQHVLRLTGTTDDPSLLPRAAEEMEKGDYTKDQIFEAYLNLIPYAENVIGVREAAFYYYGVSDLKKLTIAQSAMLAAIAVDPVGRDLFTAPDAANTARKEILKAMLDAEQITDVQYNAASAAPLPTAPTLEDTAVWDYYVDLLIEDVIDDLMAKNGCTYEEAEATVYRGGLKIYSYEDVQKQQAVQAVFDNFYYPDYGGWESISSTIFIMDYEGRTVATIGGRGQKNANRVKNRGTDVKRQPGSTVKPIAVYAPAIEKDIINYSTVVRDAPILLDAYTLWPPNYQQKPADMGWTTVKYALQQSHNTVPVRILEELGARTSYNFLTQTLHVTSPQEIDVNYGALGLGGFAEGVTAREMAAAYQVFGNSGIYNKPHTYRKVEQNGEVILEHTLENEQAISPETATIMNKLLQNVVREGTGSAISYDWSGTQVFAKTGTTDAYRDSYFVGGTSRYVAALWMGYDSFASMTPDQCAYQKQLWSQCMLALHPDGKAADFPVWGDVVSRHYDPYSGTVTDGSYGNVGWYKASKIPTEYNRIEATIYTPLTTQGAAAATTTVTTTVTSASTETTETTEATEATEATEPPTTEATEPPTTEATEPPTTEATTAPTDPPLE
ncbi:MAG: penicillin-binding protein [Clostridia bacterium]|nr:penicillin-binding protein [Clostridia bacterium]